MSDMPKITHVNERKWVPSTYDPKASKVSLFDARYNRKGRTLLSRILPGASLASQRSDTHWDIYILDGDLTVNGIKCLSGAHILCYLEEEISWSSEKGCECLVFVRTTHEWVIPKK